MAARFEHTYYVHGGPFDDEFAPFWNTDAPQQEVIHYLGYEDCVTVEIDHATGKWRYVAFEGIKLEHPSGWMPGNTDEP